MMKVEAIVLIRGFPECNALLLLEGEQLFPTLNLVAVLFFVDCFRGGFLFLIVITQLQSSFVQMSNVLFSNVSV